MIYLVTFLIILGRRRRETVTAGPSAYDRRTTDRHSARTVVHITVLMPMTHVPETGTENPYQKTGTSLLVPVFRTR